MKNQATSIPLTKMGECIPFSFDEFIFLREKNKRLRQARSVSLLISEVHAVYVRWKVQKNGDNGQRILFTKNKYKTKLCPVRALLRIREQARKLNLAAKAFEVLTGLARQKFDFMTHEDLQ